VLTIKKHFNLFLIIFLCSLFFTGCSNKGSEATMIVAAAADLKYAFTEIGQKFTEKYNIPVQFNFGSTGQLAQQIANGAPADIFSAADVASVERLAAQGVIDKQSISQYARGRIVLLSGKAAATPLNTLQDLLREDIKKIAIANPEHAPYGLAAKEALHSAGLWDQLQDKIVYGQNIRDTMTLVESGNAEAGIIALSIVQAGELPYTLIDDKLHKPIIQAMGIVQNSKNKTAAQKFAKFVQSQEGRAILKKYGFILPGEENEQQ
jgi:molybdate transport system substrate-binding protein